MTKGSKRARVKAALSPVRDILSPPGTKTSPSRSTTNSIATDSLEPQSDEDGDLMDELLAELDSRNHTVQGEAATVIREIEMSRNVNQSPLSTASGAKSPDSIGSSLSGKRDSRSRHKERLVRR
jgi:hypothetical protein